MAPKNKTTKPKTGRKKAEAAEAPDAGPGETAGEPAAGKEPELRRGQQASLPGEGYKRKVSPELEAAESDLHQAEKIKAEANTGVKAARARLVVVMQANKIEIYEYVDAEGTTVTLKANQEVKVKVRRKKRKVEQEDA